MSQALSRAAQLKPELRLAQAISGYVVDLPADEKRQFQHERNTTPQPVDVMRLTAAIDRTLASKGVRRGYGPRLTSFLQAVQQFASIGDVLIGGSQYLPACAVWTLVRFSLLAIVRDSTHVEELSAFFMQVGRASPRNEKLALLFPQSKTLQNDLTEYYIVVVKVCHEILKLSRSSMLKQLLTTFSSSLSVFRVQLNEWASAIRDEVNIQLVILNQEEARKSSKHRSVSHKYQMDRELRHKVKRRANLLKACSTYNYQTTWKQLRKAGTTALHTHDSEYIYWKAHTSPATFIYTGKLGCGKSVLLANIVDDLHLQPAHDQVAPITLYFFCRHDIGESQRPLTIVGCIVRQLLQVLNNVQDFGIQTLSADTKLTLEELSEVVRKTLPLIQRRVYLIVDGLDECSTQDRDTVFNTLKPLIEHATCGLLLSARLDPDGRSKFSSFGLTRTIFSPVSDQICEIEAYIDTEINAYIDTGRLTVRDQSLVPIIKKTLASRAQGMFLWVALLMASLCGLPSDHEIIAALEDTPATLSGIYTRLLTKKTQQNQSWQIPILELILAAYRPLSAAALGEALIVEPGEHNWNPSKLPNDITALLACCGGLVIVDEEEITVRLVHDSARQFLMEGVLPDTFQISHFSVEKRMAQTAMTYLNYAAFDTRLTRNVVLPINGRQVVGKVLDTGIASDRLLHGLSRLLRPSDDLRGPDIAKVLAETASRARTQVKPEYAFLGYANVYWFMHAAVVLDHDPMTQALLKQLIAKEYKISIDTTQISNPIIWAITHGYVHATDLLLEGVDNTDLPELIKELQHYAAVGHEASLKICLSNRPLIQLMNRSGTFQMELTEMITIAATNNHTTTMSLLLSSISETSLLQATVFLLLQTLPSLEIATILVDFLHTRCVGCVYSRDDSEKDSHCETVLGRAVIQGRIDLLELLCDGKVYDTRQRDKLGMTALWLAINHSSVEALKILIRARRRQVGNLLDLHDQLNGTTLLHKAVIRYSDATKSEAWRQGRENAKRYADRRLGLVELLVLADANIYTPMSGRRMTVIEFARSNNYGSLLTALRTTPSDTLLRPTIDHGLITLICLCSRMHLGVPISWEDIRLPGSKMRFMGQNGRSALSHAAQRGTYNSVKILLDAQGGWWNEVDICGRTPFDYARENSAVGSVEKISLLSVLLRTERKFCPSCGTSWSTGAASCGCELPEIYVSRL